LPILPIVAIIDDDASVRATTDSLVRSLGYIVSGADFLRSDRLDDLSCVIADVQMPGMSGVELQAHLLTQGYRVPFIFFTAFPDERIRAQALRAGAICYLTKPFDGDSFVQGLQAALKKQGGGAKK
jgi:FixJ family two-component response regulator